MKRLEKGRYVGDGEKGGTKWRGNEFFVLSCSFSFHHDESCKNDDGNLSDAESENG